MSQQEHASYMQSETVQTLERLNQTFQFLLSVSENSRDQLNWIQGLVQKTGAFLQYSYVNLINDVALIN